MMLPSALVEPLAGLAVELPLISARLLSMNAEITACGVCVPGADVAPDVAAEGFELVPCNALIKLWNAELKLAVTLLEALESPLRLPSNSLSPVSVTRLVNAATVEATLAAGEAVAALGAAAVLLLPSAWVLVVDAALGVLNRLVNAEAWLLPTLPIDITAPIANANRGLSAAFSIT